MGPMCPSWGGASGGDGEQDWERCLQSESREEVGGRREGLDPDKDIFCHEKENYAFAPWIIYMYVFPPAVTGE